ncbi:protein translocase subunit SecF [bacterium 3DAC]|nr:protein translocase subunit SecF [Dictyoglomota bacterium]UZN22944.1 protein translocase subunit SecF [bacterium 3DAC]
MEIIKVGNWNIVGNRNKFYAISLTVIIAGIIAMIINVATIGAPFNLGVDFTGGVVLEVQFNKAPDFQVIRDTFQKAGYGNIEVKAVDSPENTVMLRVKATSGEERDKIVNLVKTLPDFKQIVRQEFVGPSVARTLIWNAFTATIIALALILIYISVRFEFIYGLVTIAALLHDVLVLLGVFAMTRVAIDSSFVAVVLILVGYSVMDTIVVLDRIRENKHIYRGMPFEQLVNKSILSTFRRSFNTSVTTLLAALSLLIVGGRLLLSYGLGLSVGILAGTYSSIFIASPLLVDIRNWQAKRQGNKKGQRKPKRKK